VVLVSTLIGGAYNKFLEGQLFGKSPSQRSRHEQFTYNPVFQA
jgi:hypothetical protein